MAAAPFSFGMPAAAGGSSPASGAAAAAPTFGFSLTAAAATSASAPAAGSTPASSSSGVFSFGFAPPAGSASASPSLAFGAATAGSPSPSAPSAPSFTLPTFGVAPATQSSQSAQSTPSAPAAGSSASASTSGFVFPSFAAKPPQAQQPPSAAAQAGSQTQAGQTGSQAGSQPGQTPATVDKNGQQQQQQQQSKPPKQPLGPIELGLGPAAGAPVMPASYGTRFEELHPESQKMLLQLEERVMECRAQSAVLAQDDRLSLAGSRGGTHSHDFEAHAARVRQRLSAVSSSISREHASLGRVLLGAYQLLHQAEVAVRSFSLLSFKFPQLQVSEPIGGDASWLLQSAQQQQLSPYLAQTVERLEQQLAEYEHKLEELERLLIPIPAPGQGWSSQDSYGAYGPAVPFLGPNATAARVQSLLQSLHSFLIHVTAQMEPVHEAIEEAKAAFLTDRRRRGNFSDPFQDALRRQAEMERAQAQPGSAPSSAAYGGVGGPLAAGLLPPAGNPGMPGYGAPGALGSSALQQQQTQSLGFPMGTAATPAAAAIFSPFAQAPSPSPLFAVAQSPAAAFPSFSPSPTGSLFGTPTSGASLPLFGTPTSGASSPLFGTPAPAAPTFGASTGTPAQATPTFGTPSLFGSPQSGAAVTPLFGSALSTSPMFGGAGTGSFAVTTASGNSKVSSKRNPARRYQRG